MADYIMNLEYTPKNISFQISSLLQDAIISNELKGGEQIVELQLQEKMGVSRSPIREAMRELEKLGLVEIVPRKGTFVKKITAKDIRENYLVRAPLEGLAAQEAADLMNGNEYQKLADALSKMEEAADSSDAKRYWKWHSLFHNGFINSCGNGLLINLLKVLRTHSVWHRMSFDQPGEDLHASAAIHQKILKMFQDPDQDREALGHYVTKHILDVLPGFIKNIDA